MPPRSSDEIRADFVQFWLAHDGHLRPSSSLIPYNDPTVLLTTAGMQQFAGDATLLFYMSEEAQEGRDAFREKRRPDFARFPRRP